MTTSEKETEEAWILFPKDALISPAHYVYTLNPSDKVQAGFI
jgi:hypothetical protein